MEFKRTIKFFMIIFFGLCFPSIVLTMSLSASIILKSISYSLFISILYIFFTSEWWKKKVLKIHK